MLGYVHIFGTTLTKERLDKVEMKFYVNQCLTNTTL